VIGSAISALVLAACSGAPVSAPAPSPVAQPVPSAPDEAYPPTEVRDVTDSYHGVTVHDAYRWLEDGSDAAVKSWNAAQNAHARGVLDALPVADGLRARLTEVMSQKTRSYSSLAKRGDKLFAMVEQPPQPQPVIVVMSSADAPDQATVLVDPNVIDAAGTTTIDWYVPSPDGRLVAVSLSKRGTERGDLHIYDVATQKQVHEVIPGVNGGTAGGSLAWAPDGKGFFYSRYPRKGERSDADMSFYVQIYFHALGTPTEEDRYELGKDFPRIAEIELTMDQSSGRLLATVQKGDGGEFALYLRDRDAKWRQFSVFGDRILQAAFGPKDDLYLLSRHEAPRGKVLRLPIATLDPTRAVTVVPEGDDTIVDSFWAPPSVLPTKSRLYVLYQLGGPSELRVFDHQGKRLATPKQLPVGAIGDVTRVGADEVLFANWSFLEPPAFHRYGGSGEATERTKLATASPVDMSQVKVVREMAKSKDGTQVPVNILLPPGHKPGTPMPCVANGYGGYGVNITPRFRANYAVLLEHGICYAVANLRGGGEFGEQWHRQGNLTNKQNVFDDFIAVLSHLVQRGYTTNDRLAIIGGSNGGLLMGATLVQQPAMTKAVVSFVGIYDMLRVELSPNGAFNVTEFGTVKDPEHFKALMAYSPYHGVKDGVPYPAVLMLTGENDPRVDPMQSRKMVARLQAASASSAPILLRTNADAGHGGGSSLQEEINELTHAYAFIFDQLGVSAPPP
jgi:prolyl oligopeptidase